MSTVLARQLELEPSWIFPPLPQGTKPARDLGSQGAGSLPFARTLSSLRQSLVSHTLGHMA